MRGYRSQDGISSIRKNVRVAKISKKERKRGKHRIARFRLESKIKEGRNWEKEEKRRYRWKLES